MRTLSFRDILSVAAGIACFWLCGLIFTSISNSLLMNVDIGFDKIVIDFTQKGLHDIFISCSFLLMGLVTGAIAKRRGFVLGLLASIIVVLFMIIRLESWHHHAFSEPLWIGSEIVVALGWGFLSGVAGIAGVTIRAKIPTLSEWPS